MPGHYVGEGEAIIDVQVGTHRLTLCSPEAGKIMRCKPVGTLVEAGVVVTEITGVGKPTWELFVAYRQIDAPGHAGRIGADLRRYFGPGQVFKDVDTVEFGDDITDVIRAMLKRAFVMVVVIGPKWASDPRLQDPDDLHREEIRTALKRGIQVIPVFVHGAAVPAKADLPEDIRPLLGKRGIHLTEERWDYDAGVLIQTVEKALADSPRLKQFLAQVPPWDYKGWVQWIVDEPSLDHDPPKYE